ncbi:spore germination protein [Paenibacillus gansuensis]|uniref:Spore germination protein n=1 Tax=Paenibacillus gansuensis TaxID=306542 RepID=A0ABW5PCT3_9BACL
MLTGWTYIHVNGYEKGLLINTFAPKERAVTKPEVESQILGPQLAFTENLATNSALIHTYLPATSLKQESIQIGKEIKSSINLFYIENRTVPELVERIKEKLDSLNVEVLLDGSILSQWLEDQPAAMFPTFITTERLDHAIFPLLEGKVVLILSGSPFAVIAPSTFFDFFKSIEDYYFRWNTGTFIRLLRVFALVISMFGTATYVAALTFHYETIPQAFLVPLAQSRARVPFPPLFEALLLELVIQLLSEAGARLPSKVGQTMGIVGGIVIGQAAVQAGFTSNILIIIVALGALSSFTTPVFQMANTIRMLRFPLIVLSGIMGALGIAVGAVLMILHLLRLTSSGYPYFYPLEAPRRQDRKDAFFRLPYRMFPNRASFSEPAVSGNQGKGGDIDEY